MPLTHKTKKTFSNTSIAWQTGNSAGSCPSTYKMHCSHHHQTQDGVLPSQYQLHGHTLSTETEARYLGVKITADLRWDAHITDVCNKANKTLGFLRRNIKTINERIENAAYKTFVRPVLEYASPVWDPSTANNIKALQKVQRRAARWVKQDYRRSACVDTMRQQLHWPTLQKRRKQARFTTFCKFHHGLIHI